MTDSPTRPAPLAVDDKQPDAEALAAQKIKNQCAHYGGVPTRCLMNEREWPSYVKPKRCALCPDAHRRAQSTPLVPFQNRVSPWLMACFGEKIAGDKIERNHRFLEEALELVQSCGCTQSEAHQLVDYVFGRAIGEKFQEAGGVMVTFAALCLAHGLDMEEAAETELARVWTKCEAIRAKQAAKPKHGPLPQHVAQSPSGLADDARKIAELFREAILGFEDGSHYKGDYLRNKHGDAETITQLRVHIPLAESLAGKIEAIEARIIELERDAGNKQRRINELIEHLPRANTGDYYHE